ncbi:hypothetical protein B0J14DRAFT_317666 [Halenospora varia]|nr:hypothetical protein B0J14DRAFT_317666 [Halenospora varia]
MRRWTVTDAPWPSQHSQILLPVINASKPLPSTSPPQDLWSVDRLEDLFGAGTPQQQQVKARRFSEQDIKTRSARASLPPAHKHKKAAASYPIYSPNSQPVQLGFSATPPFLPWGLSQTMDSRLHSRPGSSSSVSTRSSWESRHKSPLSISSSIDYDSRSTSQESLVSSNSSHDGLRGHALPPGIRGYTESLTPTARYGERKTQTLLTPRRLSRGPPNPTAQTFAKKYKPRLLGEGFKKLPEEILLGILAELKKSHLHPASLSCQTCWMRDVTSLGMSCKKWWGAARTALYEDIQLIGCDSALHTKKKMKMKYGTRLTLLRRTLRSRPDLAEYVKSLKIPTMPDAAKTKTEQEGYMDLVASVVMACPNLERLPGFYPSYNHEYTRFVHALSTRKKLQERVWMISGSASQRQYRYNLTEDSEFLKPVAVPSFLLPEQCIDFLNFHSNWTHLQTLVMHCNTDGTMNSALFTDIFARLPSLENLHISSFSPYAFDDNTLLSLPSLKSLRLESLPGVTDHGLSNFASPARTDRLKSLTLIGLPMLSLPVLARLFSHLKSLTHFKISQAPSPCLPIGTDIFLHPYLASPTMEYIHWEFTNPDDNKATEILSKSITFSGFPALKTIRAPTDFEGSLQKLCKPRDRIELSGDKYRNIGMQPHNGIPSSQSMPSLPSPTRSTFSEKHGRTASFNSSFVKSPTRSAFSLNLDHTVGAKVGGDTDEREQGMSLAMSRRMAQQRIDAATQKPQFHIIVWDEDGNFQERHAVGGFLGQIQSKISYVLKPDLEGLDESLMGVEALLDNSEERNVRDGCTGTWNLDLSGPAKTGLGNAGKKGKERWWHSERGRWRNVQVGGLF